MKIFRLITILLFIFLLNSNYHSQMSSDLGIIYSKSSYNKLTLEYRKPMNEKFNFKIGVTYGSKSTYPFENGEIITVNDSSISQLYYGKENTMGSLKIGAERQIKESMFYVGGDIFVGYKNFSNYYYQQLSLLGQGGQWESGAFYADPNYAYDGKVERHYIVPELQIEIGMNVPLNESFILNLFIANLIGTEIYMKETGRVDPLNKFTTQIITNIDFETTVGLGLRYKVSRKKV